MLSAAVRLTLTVIFLVFVAVKAVQWWNAPSAGRSEDSPPEDEVQQPLQQVQERDAAADCRELRGPDSRTNESANSKGYSRVQPHENAEQSTAGSAVAETSAAVTGEGRDSSKQDKLVDQPLEEPEAQASDERRGSVSFLYTAEVSGYRLTVLSMPVDGNSLFSALAHQIYQVTPGQPKMARIVKTLRSDAASQLRKNKHKYWNEISSDLDNLQNRYGDGPVDEAMVRDYLCDLEQDGFPAGVAAMQALADFRSFHIRFYAADAGEGHVFSERPRDNCPTRTVHLHKYANPDGDEEYHFDSVVEIAPLDDKETDDDSSLSSQKETISTHKEKGKKLMDEE